MWTDVKDAVIVVARLFLAALFVIFGWRKVRDFSGTVAQMVRDRLPAPVLATAVSIGLEVGVASAIAVGLLTRPAAALFVFYTLGTSLAEHRYWEVRGPEQVELMEAFYKNLSIMGGFLLLFVAGAGRYSIDALLGIAGP
jgi:putative oxidoreductase